MDQESTVVGSGNRLIPAFTIEMRHSQACQTMFYWRTRRAQQVVFRSSSGRPNLNGIDLKGFIRTC